MRQTAVMLTTIPPQIEAGAQFNASLWRRLSRHVDTQIVGWQSIYPRVPGRLVLHDEAARKSWTPEPELLLAWHDPRTWRRAIRQVEQMQPSLVILRWFHPVMGVPYGYLLPRLSRSTTTVVICDNVEPHERVPFASPLTRRALRHADVLVTHAPQQRGELLALGLDGDRILEAFHPRYVAEDLAEPVEDAAAHRLRERYGADLLLLSYGAVRPYKGIDLALEALAQVDPQVKAKLIVAGRFWEGKHELCALRDELGLEQQVEFRDAYLSDDETALLFAACDAALLPYRSATQSGVAQLAFAYGRPVIATNVGGLSSAVTHGRDGLLCQPEPQSIARAIEALASSLPTLRNGVDRDPWHTSFEHYVDLILDRAGVVTLDHAHQVDWATGPPDRNTTAAIGPSTRRPSATQ
jgi:glycosyltransferase involved in cell wall biosynthesis